MISIRVVPHYQFSHQKCFNFGLFGHLGQNKIGIKGENVSTEIKTAFHADVQTTTPQNSITLKNPS